MFVRSFMSSPVVTLTSATRAIDALELMQAKKFRRIPVTEDGRLTGILTLGDIQAVLGFQEHSIRRATTKLGDIKVPCLVIHGDADAAIPLERAQILADGLADSQMVIVPGAGHAANLTHPEIVNPAIAKFLARVTA